MSDPTHPADVILGADWVDPGQRRLEHAWREHSEHDRLVELQAGRDEDGQLRWELARVHDSADGFVEVWIRPVDPLDPRPPVRVGGWPLKAEADEIAAAKAIVSEHDLGA